LRTKERNAEDARVSATATTREAFGTERGRDAPDGNRTRVLRTARRSAFADADSEEKKTGFGAAIRRLPLKSYVLPLSVVYHHPGPVR
jgi:hypothetical protein